MNTELRKRLEEAAGDYTGCKNCFTQKEGNCFKEACLFYNAYIKGGEWMFKEVIAQCREWLETNIANQVETREAEGNLMTSKEAFLADFETDMNKLWEEQK